ncbi:universal stress protein [Marivirga lumbricoides]|uniref:Universal stress protein n=1 Tax=Marivirga lumbricoides TaxID=1046115 RepID=A0A2T4DUP6_9BACT|nr:universal stress protein [Marivirga lumbricoides]
MKNILVSIDFKNDEQLLLDQAVQFAKAFSAKIWLLHIGAPDPDFVGYSVGPQYIRDAKAEDLREEHHSLQHYSELMHAQAVKAEALLIQGATVESILQEAQQLKADLIIIGHHEHSILYKIFQESVSSEVMKKSKIPVLMVPLEN